MLSLDDALNPAVCRPRVRHRGRRPDGLRRLPRRRRVFGQSAGRFEGPDDVDKPLPDDVLDQFE